MRRGFWVVAGGAIVILAGCGTSVAAPSGWGPLRTAVDTLCPNLQGAYEAATEARLSSLSDQDDTETLTLSLIAGSGFAAGNPETMPGSLEISGDANEELLVEVSGTGAAPEVLRSRRTLDYTCKDGWLSLRNVAVPPRDLASPTTASDKPVRSRELFLVGGANGSLVGRLVVTRMSEFTVWCGDGCKGIGLPWTATRRTTWMRLPRLGDDASSGPRTWRDSERDKRVRLEEQRLESGLPNRD